MDETLPQWTVNTAPPSSAERLAWRLLARRDASRYWPWSAALPSAIIFFDVTLQALLHHVYQEAFLGALLVMLTVGIAWERKGIGELIDRYDAELRGRSASGRS